MSAAPAYPGLSPRERLVLELLTERERYGIEVADASQGKLARNAIYVLLTRMRRKRLIAATPTAAPAGEIGPERRVYRVTSYGARVRAAYDAAHAVMTGAPERVLFAVTIQDKTLYREPDVALAIVESPSKEAAVRHADALILQLADQGRGRCVPHARPIELGRFYRLGALIRIPHDPNAEEESRG